MQRHTGWEVGTVIVLPPRMRPEVGAGTWGWVTGTRLLSWHLLVCSGHRLCIPSPSFSLFFSTSLPSSLWFHKVPYEVSGGLWKDVCAHSQVTLFKAEPQSHLLWEWSQIEKTYKMGKTKPVLDTGNVCFCDFSCVCFYIFWNWHLKYTWEKTRFYSVEVFFSVGGGKENSKNVCFSSQCHKGLSLKPDPCILQASVASSWVLIFVQWKY